MTVTDGQTDRQTNGQSDRIHSSAYRACTSATCDKMFALVISYILTERRFSIEAVMYMPLLNNVG